MMAVTVILLLWADFCWQARTCRGLGAQPRPQWTDKRQGESAGLRLLWRLKAILIVLCLIPHLDYTCRVPLARPVPVAPGGIQPSRSGKYKRSGPGVGELHPGRGGPRPSCPRWSRTLWWCHGPRRGPRPRRARKQESQPPGLRPRDRRGARPWQEAAPPSEGRPHRSPNFRYRLCPWETDLPGSAPRPVPSLQPLPRTCEPPNEDLHHVLWGELSPGVSGGPPGSGRPCPAQAHPCAATPRRDCGPGFLPRQPTVPPGGPQS